MEDQSHQHPTTTTKSASSSSVQPASAEPARSRWTPKPEQILILESIFNSGTVNPSKHDAIRIRCLLEKLGPVGDANVFYWFQNRRSRSRRRQRELQASSNSLHPPPTSPGGSGGGGLQYTSSCTPPYANLGLLNNNNNNNNIISLGGGGGGCQLAPSSSSCVGVYASSAAGGGGGGCDVFWNPPIPLADEHNPIFAFHNRYPQPPSGDGGMISVFVNGVATQVPAGSFDVKAVFGEDVILVHSTGAPVPVDDFGFCFYGLLHGETYFLVPRVP